MMRWLASMLFCLAVAGTSIGAAAQSDGTDPKSHQRAARLAEVLRCLVCQNQSIADSNASLAKDLKLQIRDQIAQGRSDDEILAYMVARYGDFVLYRPPVKWTTIVLWGGPFVALIAGLIALGVLLSKSAQQAQSLTDEERERAAALLVGPEQAGR